MVSIAKGNLILSAYIYLVEAVMHNIFIMTISKGDWRVPIVIIFNCTYSSHTSVIYRERESTDQTFNFTHLAAYSFM